MDGSTPGFPVLHQLPKLAQTHVHQVGDAIQPSHPLSSPSPPAFNLSVSWFAQDFVCALQDWSLSFPQSCRSPIIKFHWTSRPDSILWSSPLDSQSLCQIPRLESLTWSSEPSQWNGNPSSYSWSQRMESTNLQTLTVASEQDLLRRRKIQSSQHRHWEGVNSPLEGGAYSSFLSLPVLVCTFLVGSGSCP